MKKIIVLFFCIILSGCITVNPAEDNICPNTSFVRDTSTITEFKDDKIISKAALKDLSGTCSYKKGVIKVKTSLEIYAELAPGIEQDKLEYPYFIALLDGNDNILNKKTFIAELETDAKIGSLIIEDNNFTFPLESSNNIKNYSIIFGFDLNKQQLKYNREGKI